MQDKIVQIKHNYENNNLKNKFKFTLFSFFFKINYKRNCSILMGTLSLVFCFLQLVSILKFEKSFFEKTEFNYVFPSIPKILFNIEIIDQIIDYDVSILTYIVYSFSVVLIIAILWVYVQIVLRSNINNSLVSKVSLEIIRSGFLMFEHVLNLPIFYVLFKLDYSNELGKSIINIILIIFYIILSFAIAFFNNISCYNERDFFSTKKRSYSEYLLFVKLLFLFCKLVYEKNSNFLTICYILIFFSLAKLVLVSFSDCIYNNSQTYSKVYISLVFLLIERLTNSIISKAHFQSYKTVYKDYYIPSVVTFSITYILLTKVYFKSLNNYSLEFHSYEKFDLLEIKETTANKYIYKEPNNQGKALNELKYDIKKFLKYLICLMNIIKCDNSENKVKLAGFLLIHRECCENADCPLNSNLKLFQEISNIKVNKKNITTDKSKNTKFITPYNGGLGSKVAGLESLVSNNDTQINMNVQYHPLLFTTSDPTAEFYNDEVMILHIIKEMFYIYGREYRGDFIYYAYFINYLIFVIGNYELALIQIEQCKVTFYDLNLEMSLTEEFYLYGLKEIANDFLIIHSEFNNSNINEILSETKSFNPYINNNQGNNSSINLASPNLLQQYYSSIFKEESGKKWSKTKNSPWSVVKMLNVLKYDQTFADLKKTVLNTMEIKRKIWNSFKSRIIVAEDIFNYGKEYLMLQSQTTKNWKLLNDESDNNPDSAITSFYSWFLREICNDKSTSEKILENKYNPRLLNFNITNDELFNNRYKTDTGVVIIDNKKLSNPGIINYVNDTLVDFLSFKKKELIGNNISMIMPSLIGSVHNELITNYYMKGKSYFLGKTTSSLSVKNKQKYLVPVHFLATILPSFNNSVEGIALIRKKQQVEEIIITDYEGNIDSLTEDIAKQIKVGYHNILKHDCSIFNYFPDLLKPEEVVIPKSTLNLIQNFKLRNNINNDDNLSEKDSDDDSKIKNRKTRKSNKSLVVMPNQATKNPNLLIKLPKIFLTELFDFKKYEFKADLVIPQDESVSLRIKNQVFLENKCNTTTKLLSEKNRLILLKVNSMNMTTSKINNSINKEAVNDNEVHRSASNNLLNATTKLPNISNINNSYLSENNNTLNNSKHVEVASIKTKNFYTFSDLSVENYKNSIEDSLAVFFDLYIAQIKYKKEFISYNSENNTNNFNTNNKEYKDKSINKGINDSNFLTFNEFCFIYNNYSNFLNFSEKELLLIQQIYENVSRYYEKIARFEISNDDYSVNLNNTHNNTNALEVIDDRDFLLKKHSDKLVLTNGHANSVSIKKLQSNDFPSMSRKQSQQSFKLAKKSNFFDSPQIAYNYNYNYIPSNNKKLDSRYFSKKEVSLNHLGVQLTSVNVKMRIFTIPKESLFEKEENINSVRNSLGEKLGKNDKIQKDYNNILGYNKGNSVELGSEKNKKNNELNPNINQDNIIDDTASITNNAGNYSELDLTKFKYTEGSTLIHKVIGVVICLIVLLSSLVSILIISNNKTFIKEYLYLSKIFSDRNTNLIQIGRLSRVKLIELFTEQDFIKDDLNILIKNIELYTSSNDKFSKELILADEDMIARVNTNTLMKSYSDAYLLTLKSYFNYNNDLITKWLVEIINEYKKIDYSSTIHNNAQALNNYFLDKSVILLEPLNHKFEDYYKPFYVNSFEKINIEKMMTVFNKEFNIIYNCFTLLDELDKLIKYKLSTEISTTTTIDNTLNNNALGLLDNKRKIKYLANLLIDNINNFLNILNRINLVDTISLKSIKNKYIEGQKLLHLYLFVSSIFSIIILLALGFYFFRKKKDKHNDMLKVFNTISNDEISNILNRIDKFEFKYTKYFMQLDEYRKKKIEISNGKAKKQGNLKNLSKIDYNNQLDDDDEEASLNNNILDKIRNNSKISLEDYQANDSDIDVEINTHNLKDNNKISNNHINNKDKNEDNDDMENVRLTEYGEVKSKLDQKKKIPTDPNVRNMRSKVVINKMNVVYSYVLSIFGLVFYILLFKLAEYLLLSRGFNTTEKVVSLNQLSISNSQKFIYLTNKIDVLFFNTFPITGRPLVLVDSEIYEIKNNFKSTKASNINKLANSTYNTFLEYTSLVNEYSELFENNVTNLLENEICNSANTALINSNLCQNINYIKKTCEGMDTSCTHINELEFIQKKGIKSIFSYYTEAVLEANSVLKKIIQKSTLNKFTLQKEKRNLAVILSSLEKIIKPRFLVEVLIEMFGILNDNFVKETNSLMSMLTLIMVLVYIFLSLVLVALIFFRLSAFANLLSQERMLSNKLILEIPDFIFIENKLLQEELVRISKSDRDNYKKEKADKTIGGRKIEIAIIEEESKEEKK